jgi:hypothetical protein
VGRDDHTQVRLRLSDASALALWIVLIFGICLWTSQPARALSGNELLLFRDAAGTGYTYCDAYSTPYGQPVLYLTQAANSLGAYGWNDVASAYKQSGGWTLYENNNFSGQFLQTVYTGVCNLGSTWNDRISSVTP